MKYYFVMEVLFLDGYWLDDTLNITEFQSYVWHMIVTHLPNKLNYLTTNLPFHLSNWLQNLNFSKSGFEQL